MPSKVSKTTSSKTPAKSTTKSSTSKTSKVETKPVKATPTADTAPPLAVVQQLDDVQQTIISLSTQLRSLTTQLKHVQKTYTKERKQLEKLYKKKKHGGGSGVKHQSGIAKPGYISAELCDFIGVSTGTEMARTEVIKYVNKYIKDHQLQDQNNKKVIVPDSKLQTLLQSSKNDEITYFNLQTYMKPHYADPKKQMSAVA